MHKSLKRFGLFLSGAAITALMAVSVAGATADPQLTDATGQVTDYFTANLGTVVGAFIAVTGVLWLLGMAFRSVGIHRRKSVG